MQGLNLHNIVASALQPLNPYRDLVFTKTVVEWVQTSRIPVVTETQVTVKGKIQPANLQELKETGFNLQEYQYFKVYLSFDATQLDQLRQLGSDTFVLNNYGVLETYQIVAKEDWIQNGWREVYCYLVGVENEAS